MVSERHDKDGEAEQEWDASWAGQERAQFNAILSSTPAQRLAWLEEVTRLAHASGALPCRDEG